MHKFAYLPGKAALLTALLLGAPLLGFAQASAPPSQEWHIDFQGDGNHGGTYGQTGPAAYSTPDGYWNVFEVAALRQPWPTLNTPSPSLGLRDAGGEESQAVLSFQGDLYGWAGRGDFDPLFGDYLIFTQFNPFGAANNPTWWRITGLDPSTRYCLTFYHPITNPPYPRGLLFGLLGADSALVAVGGTEGENVVSICIESSEAGTITGFVTVDARVGLEGDWAGLSIRRAD